MKKRLPCPLCRSSDTELVFKDIETCYYQCAECALIYVPSFYHLSKEEEKKRYDLHENNPGDQRYRTFLNTLIKPLAKKLTPGASGLDYGCGPGPTVSKMLSDLGFSMKNYDPYYLNDPALLGNIYDFVTCTEVIEHFRDPGNDWRRLVNLVRKSGWIGIMTNFACGIEDFSSWHYRRDPTHICFYSKKTFSWIAEHHTLEAFFPCNRIVLFKKR